MKTIYDYDFQNKTALIRVDFNVPRDEQFQVVDKTRIHAAVPTIQKVLRDGGKVVLMSHLGRPDGIFSEKYSLKSVVPLVSEVLRIPVKFTHDCVGKEIEEIVSVLKNGEVLLLENLRFHKEEEIGDENFAYSLAQLGDIYVNDAFGVAHRSHASTTIIAKFFPNKKCFGFFIIQEIRSINKVLKDGQKPITAILGGAKVSSKISVIRNILPVVDHMLICGGMTYTFIKAQGGKIGDSIVENDKLDIVFDILEQAKQNNVKIHLPLDVIVADDFREDAQIRLVSVDAIPDGWQGLDIGTLSIERFSKVISSSKTILWNGPVGVFEFSSFSGGTSAVAESVVEATQKGAFSLVGGGDSVAALKKLGYENKVSYVSTGGGAMLESLEGRKLPGISAIMET
ncbi:MAG: phosphoglycerate kinase [Flavobacteriales bacterium AspAUS03]